MLNSSPLNLQMPVGAKIVTLDTSQACQPVQAFIEKAKVDLATSYLENLNSCNDNIITADSKTRNKSNGDSVRPIALSQMLTSVR